MQVTHFRRIGNSVGITLNRGLRAILGAGEGSPVAIIARPDRARVWLLTLDEAEALRVWAELRERYRPHLAALGLSFSGHVAAMLPPPEAALRSETAVAVARRGCRLTRTLVEALHDDVAAQIGGADGLRDPAALDEVLAAAEEAADRAAAAQAAAAVVGLVRRRPFRAGNPNTALAVLLLVLRTAGYLPEPPDQAGPALAAVVGAAGEMDEEALAQWIEREMARLDEQNAR